MGAIPRGGRYGTQITRATGVGVPPFLWGGRYAYQLRGAPTPPVEESTWPLYLTRPVFQWAIDWSDSPRFMLDLNLQETDPGFGDVSFWRDQEFVGHGWTFSVPLDTAQAIRDVEDFFDELQGRRLGFWLITPLQAFRIVTADTTASFYAKDRDASVTWQDHTRSHLAFTKAGETTRYAEVDSVTDVLDGRELVRLTSAIGTLVDSTWQCWVIAYVRLTKDDEEGEFEANDHLYRTFKVVELPQEYAGYETGRRPVYLYLFEARDGGSPVVWRHTSFNWDFDDGTDLWTAKRITHKAVKRNSDATREETTIEAEWEPGTPLYQLAPPALAMPLYLTIIEADYLAPATQTVLFTGQVLGPVDLDGKTITAKVASILDVMGGELPSMVFQPVCNYRVYQSATCRADRAAFEKAATFTSLNGRTVIVDGAGLAATEENWFAMGWIETGSGQQFERRSVIASSAASGTAVTLTLNAPLYYAAPGGAVVCVPGCDGKPDTCLVKFSNFANFGGHRYAYKNLTIKALSSPNIDTAKK